MKKFLAILVVIFTLGNLTGWLIDRFMIFAVPVGLFTLFLIMSILALDKNLKKQ